jgi:hypothetical protein
MRRFFGLCLLVLATGACGGRPPVIQPIGDQVAAVGVELEIMLRANDPGGGAITFSFVAPDLPDLKTRQSPATIQSFADGVAIFRWTPRPSDSNATHPIDFHASNGKTSAVETVQIAVKDSTGDGPIIREPAGTGTTLNTATTPCLDVPVLVQDDGAPAVTITQDDPVIEGATMNKMDSFTANWHWCPTVQQVQAQDRYYLRIGADDGIAPKVQKVPPYLIVLLSTPPTNCPGQPPAISHTPPAPQMTVQDLTITAMVTDDVGVKNAPLLYWSTTSPGDPPDLTKMTPVQMVKESGGTATSAVYDGVIPNPVATATAGTSATVYYVIVAKDADNPAINCSHTSQAPATATFTLMVTNPGNVMGAGVCAACTSDTQCGGDADNCLPIGPGKFCSRACGGALPSCPTGYNCSTGNVASVDGVASRQCLPTSGFCGPGPGQCTNDSLEDNNSRTGIVNTTAKDLPPNVYPGLIMCPPSPTVVDEDWYGISVPMEATLNISFTGPTGSDKSDLDLELVDDNGGLLDFSGTLTNTESVSACLKGGATVKVYAHVTTFDPSPKPTSYDLTFTRTVGACP